MWGMIMIPMYRLWLHGLYGLYGPRCPLSPKRLLNLITHSLSLEIVPKDPINNIPALVQIMAWHPPGDKPLSEPVMIKLSTHICITRPQWVNIMIVNNVIWARKIFFGIIDWQKIYPKQNLCSSLCLLMSHPIILLTPKRSGSNCTNVLLNSFYEFISSPLPIIFLLWMTWSSIDESQQILMAKISYVNAIELDWWKSTNLDNQNVLSNL